MKQTHRKRRTRYTHMDMCQESEGPKLLNYLFATWAIKGRKSIWDLLSSQDDLEGEVTDEKQQIEDG